MIGYLYSIVNETTKKRYIGITSDYNRRIKKHLTELRSNKHHSPKLQNAWNYYGEKDFTFSFRSIEINNYDDLYELEIEEIKKYNSYNEGYNCNSGGKISDWKQKISEENIIDFLCILSQYGDGYGKTIEDLFGWSRGTASRIKRRLGYLDSIAKFDNLSADEITIRAKTLYDKLNIENKRLERQLTQGGCLNAYKLTKEDIYFAFFCQEQGIKYSIIADYLNIKSATVKDWYNGRSRAKEKKEYLSLNKEELNQLIGRFKIAELSGKPKSISY